MYKKNIIINRNSLVSYNGNLSIYKGNIVNEDKEIVKLKGVSSHNLYWYKRIYTKDNLKEMRDTWGMNVFRIALYTNPKEEGYFSGEVLVGRLSEGACEGSAPFVTQNGLALEVRSFGVGECCRCEEGEP